MQATTTTMSLCGLDAHPVRVEVDSGRGLPRFSIVGLPQACVRESRMRVQAALAPMGVELNHFAITVNLAPAYLKKRGSAFDVAIALGVLVALERVPARRLDGLVLLGELSLGGEVRPVRGVLPSLVGALAHGYSRAIVPLGNGAEAAVVDHVDICVARDLPELVAFAKGEIELAHAVQRAATDAVPYLADFAEVRGQQTARRALEVAAAGRHNLLMVGPPGVGKTMLARRLPTILPPLTRQEALSVTALHSVAGLLGADAGLVSQRPFRAPHHTTSSAALLGGGDPLRPGELSLAHHGCLFLDELAEFPRHVLEGMRQPLETGEIAVCRARARTTFPACPIVIAAVNPCPCGYAQIESRCRCAPHQVERYRARLSGPLLDRIDQHVVLAPVPLDQLDGLPHGEPSATMRERVVAAREVQRQRFAAGETSAPVNGALTLADLERVARLDLAGQRAVRDALEHLGLSARGYVKVRRVARTIADLEGASGVDVAHVQEAVAARSLDRPPPPLACAS